jgi:hypothetical protein
MVRLAPGFGYSGRLWPIAAAASLLVVTALAACTVRVDIDPATLETPTPLVEPLPIKVGILYDDALLHHLHREQDDDQVQVAEYRLGPPTKAFFDAIFAAMFETVEPIGSQPSDAAAGSTLAGVIHLSLVRFSAPNYTFPAGVPEGVFRPAYIGYSMIVYAPQGRELVSVTGYGSSVARLMGFEEAVFQAIRGAAADLMTKFYRTPDIKSWIESLSRSDHGVPEANP